jgi:general secretion pathway protein B
MSILLDALRKSEKNKHKRSVPTIHTADQAIPDSGPFRFGLAILIIVVALVLNGWSVWRQYRLPDVGYQPPVTLAPDRTPVVAEQVASSQPDAGDASGKPAETVVINKPKTEQRTPVESYKEPAPKPSQQDSSVTKPLAQDAPAKPIADGGSNKPVSQTPQPRPAAPVKPKEEAPHQPEPIGYWELPDAVRANLSEIKFSVLVYADDADDRFVLINGQRLKQGDSLPAGLVVKEIRRDGVIFSYRLYQFLVEK